MRTSLRPLLAALLAVLVASCSSTGDAAATVDGDAITRDELEASMASAATGLPEGAEESPEAVASRQRQILTILIQDAILHDVGEDLGVEVAEDDLEAARERILSQIGGEEALEQALTSSGLSQNAFEEVIVPQEALVQEMRLELAGDEALETRTARHILVETEEEAEDVIAELEAGADFGTLAEERSTDPGSAAQGGELGAQPQGQFVPEFDEALWAAELDTVIGPVETEFGFHVIEATDETAVAPEEMTPTQLNDLVGVELGGLLAAEFEESEISVDSGIGEWDANTRSVVPGDAVGDAEPQEPAVPGVGGTDPQGDTGSEVPAENGASTDGNGGAEAETGDDPAAPEGAEAEADAGDGSDGTAPESSPAS